MTRVIVDSIEIIINLPENKVKIAYNSTRITIDKTKSAQELNLDMLALRQNVSRVK